MREAQAGIEDLKDFDDPNALARAWRLMSLVYGVSGRYEACGDANEKAIECSTRRGPGDGEATLRDGVARARAGSDARTRRASPDASR